MKFFFAAYHCRFKPRTDSDSISVGSWLKPVVMIQYHRWFLAKTDRDMNRQWRPEYQCRLILLLPVLAKNRQWWSITVSFLKSGSDEADSDVQFYSSVVWRVNKNRAFTCIEEEREEKCFMGWNEWVVSKRWKPDQTRTEGQRFTGASNRRDVTVSTNQRHRSSEISAPFHRKIAN